MNHLPKQVLRMSAAVMNPNFRGSTSTVVGLLACQQDSYLTKLRSKVVSCSEYVPPAPAANEKKKKKGSAPAPAKKQYEVELEDTVLFPEGGGQPSDTGLFVVEQDGSKEVPVEKVRRDGVKALHLVDEPLELGTPVSMKVDWDRRLDLMQQHTGQHLLSAILDKRNVETVGWAMGTGAAPAFNYVELNRKLTPEEVDNVQAEVTEAIQQAHPISVEIPEDDVDHHAPEDYDTSVGVIRVVKIGELDRNPCCGTHLKSTAAVQALALYWQQTNKGTNSRLFFLAGKRVTDYSRTANEIIRKANAALSCQTEEIEEKIARLNTSLREVSNSEKFWMGEAARNEAATLKAKLAESPVALYHNAKGNMEFFKALEKEIGEINGTIVLVGGSGKEGGMIIVSGKDVADVVPRVTKHVANVKGGGKGKWQGKVLSWEKGSLEALVAEFA